MNSVHDTILTYVIGVLFPSQCFQLLVMFMLGMLHQQERTVMVNNKYSLTLVTRLFNIHSLLQMAEPEYSSVHTVWTMPLCIIVQEFNNTLDYNIQIHCILIETV